MDFEGRVAGGAGVAALRLEVALEVVSRFVVVDQMHPSCRTCKKRWLSVSMRCKLVMRCRFRLPSMAGGAWEKQTAGMGKRGAFPLEV